MCNIHIKTDFVITGAVAAVVLLLIIPLPAIFLDILIGLNLFLVLFLLLIVLCTRKATDFSSLPAVLLLFTFFGLIINVSSVRLILTKGADFDGRIIRAVSSLVAAGSNGMADLIIRFMIFSVIIAVLVVVITKKSIFITAENARFTLDALPGKQMAVETEYNSGAITEEVLISRKNDLQREVDFYGAMDGACRFVSGNVKVGFFIIIVIALGGIVLGVHFFNESLNDAAKTFIPLSIGNGVVQLFPAILLSAVSGVIISREAK